MLDGLSDRGDLVKASEVRHLRVLFHAEVDSVQALSFTLLTANDAVDED